MPGLTGVGPTGRVGAAKAIHDLLHMLEGHIPSLDLNDKDHDIDVAEKAKLHPCDVEQ